MAIDNIRDRIYELVEQSLPAYSLGINVLGFDVVFGNWNTGEPGTIAGYAIVLVARSSLAGGAVILGKQVPAEVSIHVIGQLVTGPDGSQQMAGDFWPSENSIKGHVDQICRAIKQQITQRQAPSNGKGSVDNPFTEAIREFRKRQQDQ